MKVKELMLALSKYDGEEEVRCVRLYEDEKKGEDFEILRVDTIHVQENECHEEFIGPSICFHM